MNQTLNILDQTSAQIMNRTQKNKTIDQPELLQEYLLHDPAPLAALPHDGTVSNSKGKSKCSDFVKLLLLHHEKLQEWRHQGTVCSKKQQVLSAMNR